MSEDAPAPIIGRRHRRLRALAAFGLVVAGVVQIVESTGSALGPVIPVIAPGELLPVSPSFPFDQIVNPNISGRGEVVALVDQPTLAELDTAQAGFPALDVGGAEQMFIGYTAAVSDNGCVGLWARTAVSGEFPYVSQGFTNRCTGEERELNQHFAPYPDSTRAAASFDGRFAVFESPEFGDFEEQIVRYNLTDPKDVRVHPASVQRWRSELGLDISDDGNVVVTVAQINAQVSDVVIWEVSTGAILTLGTGLSSGVSISGDGRFVAYDTTLPNAAGRRAVFVFDRVTGGRQQISPSTVTAAWPGISSDGTQVSYAIACNGRNCAASENRVDVAFSSVPGLTSGIQYDTITLGPSGANVTGGHFFTDISGNGRWVVFGSTSGAALTGNTAIFGRQAFVRRRDPAIAIDELNFGQVLVGGSSLLAATVRNTGRTSVLLGGFSSSSGRFVIEGGGTCATGSSLPPGATCTINVRFNAPGTAGNQEATLTVSEGPVYDSISGSGKAVAAVVTRPVQTTTLPATTTTTTTVAGQVPQPTTTTTTTTTTVPGSVVLDAQPSPLDFGSVAVGIAAPFQTLTVTNLGTASGVVSTEMLGSNPDDFFVSENLCSGATLAPGASCTITVTMVALAGGPRSAALTITSGGVGGDVTLQGVGRFAPRMVASPGAVTERGFTTIFGQGFPPNESFEVRVVDTPLVFSVTSDAAGGFRLPLSPLSPSSRLTLGDYVLSVAATSAFEEVKAALVVVLPTFEPQGPGGPAFGNTLIVTRGG